MSLQKWKRKKVKAVDDGDLEQLYQSCLELAGIYSEENEYESALKEYKDAKRAAEALNKTIYVAHVHRAIADLYNSMLNNELAIKHGLKHLELAHMCNDVAEEQRALANLGHMYHTKADTFTNPQSAERLEALDKAREYSLKSLRMCDRLTNISKKELFKMQAGACLNIGLALEQENEEEALSYYNKAVNLCKSMDIWDTMYRTYYALGSMFQSKARHARALEYFDKALDAAQRLQDNNSICYILLQQADVQFDLPNFRGAKQCLLKAYKINTPNRNEVERKLRTVAAVKTAEEELLDTPDCDLVTRKSLYEKLGDGCVAMKNYTKALEYYNMMLETARDLGEEGDQLRPCLVSLSQTYKDNRQYDLAWKYLRQELQLYDNNPLEACKTSLNIADVLEVKEADHEEVMEAYQRARSLAQECGNIKLEARTLSEMIRVLNKDNRLCEARKMEAELGNLQEKFGPLSCSSESEEEENTPDIGADICIDDLSDAEKENLPNTAVRVRKKNPSTKFKRNEKGEFPLHTACINGNINLVRKLLDQGHPVNVRDHSGWLPLHEACNYGYVEIVAELLDRGAAINDCGTETVGGMTPLMDAASCGNLDVMQLLLDRGASPVMRNNKRESVLDCLNEWRKRYIEDEKRDLDSATLQQFKALKKTLSVALKKAGQCAETEAASASPPSPVLNESNLQEQFAITHRSAEDVSSLQSSSHSCLRRGGDSKGITSRGRLSDSRRSDSSAATRQYEDAMKALRRKSSPVQKRSSPPLPKKAALVSEEESRVQDDWLVADIGETGPGQGSSRGVKRRRMQQFEDEPQRRTSRSFSPPLRHGFRPLSPVNTAQSSDSNDSMSNQPMKDGLHAEELFEPTQPRLGEETQQQSQRITRTSRAYQVPLSAFGVVRNPEVRELAPPPPQDPPPPLSQMYGSQQVAPVALKVRVKDKLLLIPLPPTTDIPHTIAWLADEASKRYYSFEGMEPQLTLSTSDGALLAPQDPVTLLLGCPEVKAEVTSWRQHSVTQRYREACSQLNLEVDEHLERCLDVSQASLSLCLDGCELATETVRPVLRASAHLSCLQTLILSDNRLGDSGMQLVVGTVTKLPHLRELDLTGNGITSEGLNLFVQQVIEHQACKRLEVLRLCYNRLGRSCVNLLSRLFPSACPALNTLTLSRVFLESSSCDGVLTLPLERLEAGNNPLGAEGVAALLRALDASRVAVLRLPHCGPSVPGQVARWLADGNPCSLRTLDLAYCLDTPQVFSQLIRCLEKAPLLEHLELTFPEMQEPEDIQTLLRLPRLRILRLPGVSVPVECISLAPLTLQLSCTSLSPSSTPVGMSKGPFGFLTNSMS